MPLLKKQILFIFVLLLPLLPKAQTVYTTPSGSKYHLTSCKMVKNVSKETEINDAIKTGFTPCKICKPPLVTNGTSLSILKAKGQNRTVQCIGHTRKGNRCRHVTSIANGYCYQHQK